MWNDLAQDLRYSLRTLAAQRGLTAAAVLTLAFAIGANTAVFSLVHGVLLSPLPYEEPHELLSVWHRQLDGTSEWVPVAPGNLADWRSQVRSFAAMSAWAIGSWDMTIDGEPTPLNGLISIGSPLELVGATAQLGRIFSAAEADRGEPVIVLSDDAWQRLLGGDPAAVGKPLELGETQLEVIGVMPQGFRFLAAQVDFWTPVPWQEIDPGGLLEGVGDFRSSRDQRLFIVGARLADGVSMEEARREMETIMARQRDDHPRANTGLGVRVLTLRELLTFSVQPRLGLLMGAVVLVLLIGCVNLANLLLGRAAARRREMAVRQSLGAGRRRLLRQLLTESVVLAVVGGLAGLGLGALLLKAILRFFPWQLPRAEEVALDAPVFAFTLGLAIVAGFLFGVLPALDLSRRTSMSALRHGSDRRWGRRVFQGLMVAEIALAMVLIHGEGLLLKSFAALLDVDPGFSSQELLTLRVDAADDENLTSEVALARFQEIEDRVASLPGVDSATLANFLPLDGFQPKSGLSIVGQPRPDGTPVERVAPDRVVYRVISPSYFDVMGIPLVRGRHLGADHRLGGAPAVVVNAAFAARYFPDADPLGQRLVLGNRDEPRTPEVPIVGIVGDVRQQRLSRPSLPTIYVPRAVIPSFYSFALIVKPAVAERGSVPSGLGTSIRDTIRDVDPGAPIATVRTFEEILSQQVAPARSVALLLGLFTILALALAALGVFGVISYSVTRRSREFGIRMALGAERGRILRLVAGQAGVLAGVGLVAGIAGALAFGRLLESQLFEVSWHDGSTLVAVALLLGSVAGFAVYLPARRATRLDPVLVLRDE